MDSERVFSCVWTSQRSQLYASSSSRYQRHREFHISAVCIELQPMNFMKCMNIPLVWCRLLLRRL